MKDNAHVFRCDSNRCDDMAGVTHVRRTRTKVHLDGYCCLGGTRVVVAILAAVLFSLRAPLLPQQYISCHFVLSKRDIYATYYVTIDNILYSI